MLSRRAILQLSLSVHPRLHPPSYHPPIMLRLGKRELSRITPHKAPGQLLTMIILSLLMPNDRGSLGMPPHHSSSTSRRSCRHRPSPRQPSNHDNAEGFRQV